MNPLNGKVVLITGAAGGIATPLVALLAREGAYLALIDSNQERLSVLAARMREQFLTPVSCAVSDLTTERGVRFGIAKALATFDERVDILIACVGVLVSGRFEALSSEQWQQAFAINFFSHVWAVQAVLPLFQRQGQGRILMMGSDQGRQPDAGLSAYASSKAALHSLTKTLARELAPEIIVNAVAPGMTRTPLVTALMTGYAQEFQTTDLAEAERRELARRGVPLGRLGEPEEVAHAALFLLQNDFTNGAILDISGGNVRGLS